ncbi:transglutaminase family protein [Methylophilus sp. QUAN]|uniref:transglutaminase family protein n=1 Tax=Methylophilus sp. QUAN TaxID=2781020 RepID=UPI00188E0284|nr:transglutaminase family protein [Methylophilus sp. QUAN]MBF4989757.1 transglutaminase family protein [Methylophilus sp. QUAN]
MRYQVEHQTVYSYDTCVIQSQQLLHMMPRQTDFQQCVSYTLACEPSPAEQSRRCDSFGNHNDYLTLLTPHQSLEVTSRFQVDVQPRPTMQTLMQSPAWEQVQAMLQLQGTQHLEATPFIYATARVKCSEALATFAQTCFTPQRPLLEAAMSLTQQIYAEFEFDAQATDISTPLDEVLKGRRGVCQDFAHLMIGALRSLGLACRYVSGYILTHPPAGQPRLVGADASHAWISVYCPVNGWVDFDPTNNCLVQQEHITVAWGRDFGDVSPMRGVVLGGGQQQLTVSVTVTPLAYAAA